MEIRKRFSPSIKGKKNGRSKTNHGNGSDKIEEKTEEKEIVVSLKKLKTKIKGDNGINGKEVEIEGEKYTLLKIIEKLKNDREKAKKILINWINKFYNDIIENDNNKLALIYCLETFAFRKDFRNEVKVKFGNASTQLQQKVIQFGNKKEIKCENMEELHKKIKSTEKISDEITKLEAGKSAKARRASRKLLKKAILETNTIKHKLIQKLKPPIEKRTTTRTIPTGGNNAGTGEVNLVLTQLSPKAQKEFDRLRTKVYGYGFIGARNGGGNAFVSELKSLEHHDFGNLKVAIKGEKELTDLTALIEYLKDNKSTDNLPYTTTFLDDLIKTCEELERQLKSSQTPEKQPLSGEGESSDNSQIGREENVVDGTPSPQAVEAIEMEEDTTPQIRTVEVKKAEKPELEEATVVGNPQGPQPQPQLATKGNFKPTPMQQVTIEKVDLHGQEATVVGNPQGAKPQQHSASQYISKQVEEALANENITFEGAKRVLDDIKTDEATSHMKTVLAKIPEPIRGNKFPENSELLGVNEDDYKNIKKIWLKAQELAPNESVTGTTPPPKILKPNFPISEAALQATALEGTQGAEPQPQLEEAEYVDNTTEMKQLKIERVQSLEPNEAIFVDEPIAGEDSHVGQHSQQHGAGDPSLKKAPSQTAQTPKAARMVGRARHSQIGRKGQTNNNRFGIDKKRSKK